MDFLAHLNREAFADLDIAASLDEHGIDLQGWKCGHFDEQFARHLDKARRRHEATADDDPLIIVEVGAWKGKSTASMAAACRAAGQQHAGQQHVGHAGQHAFRIVAVDTWLGAPEFWTWGLHDPERGAALNARHGFPTVFHTFTRNMKRLGYDDLVCPLPISSVQGAAVLRHYDIQADIVYVDASHEHEAVAADLAAY